MMPRVWGKVEGTIKGQGEEEEEEEEQEGVQRGA